MACRDRGGHLLVLEQKLGPPLSQPTSWAPVLSPFLSLVLTALPMLPRPQPAAFLQLSGIPHGLAHPPG
jgi:hypothetical protein